MTRMKRTVGLIGVWALAASSFGGDANFVRTFDGTLEGVGFAGGAQTGAYVLDRGDVKVCNKVSGKPVFVKTPFGTGIKSYSPWYHEGMPVVNVFALVVRAKATATPNYILANLGTMRAENESLMLVTESARSVRLAVVCGATPKIVRSVSVPVADVERFHSYALVHGADGNVSVFVDGKETLVRLPFAYSEGSLQILGGYNKQRYLGEYAHGCVNDGNIVDDVRFFDRALAAADLAACAAGCPAGEARAKPAAGACVEWPVLKRYDQNHVEQIVLPLGGIGAGTIGLAGYGELRDWELFNRPNVGMRRDLPVFAITAKGGKTQRASSILSGPVDDHPLVQGFGNPWPYAGYPHFEAVSFDGAFPFGIVHLRDATLPYRVDLKAFSPFVPGDSAASSTPLASFEYVVENLTDEPLTVSIAGFGRSAMGGYHLIRESAMLRGLMTCSLSGGTSLDAGSYALVTDDEGEVSYRTSGIQGDPWGVSNAVDFWDDFTDDGRLLPRERFHDRNGPQASPQGALCVTKTVPAHAKVSFRFAYVWNFPNRYGWSKAVIGNWYSKNYGDAWDAAHKIWPKIPDLERRSANFVRAYVASDEPEAVKDAALSSLSVYKSQTLFRDGEGRMMGYEGMGDTGGACKGSTTHVWNYEFATAALFGDLARSMREIEFRYSTFEDGWMVMRFRLPLEKQARAVDWDSGTAADGQMGCIVKAYREWKWSGDSAWLKSIWPKVKAALAFAWKGASKWDANADGVMEGKQHNTFDINFYGPNPLVEFWYLAALRAGEEMAKGMGDDAFAAECRRLFTSGSRFVDEKMFNGDYFWQLIPEDKQGEPAQLGLGCLSDQLLGQQAAHLAGLGDLVDPAHAKRASESILKFNFRSDFTHYFNHKRVYAAGKDAGLQITSWPRGGREKFPFAYYSEVWTGIEYVAAAEMANEGLDTAALQVVSAARARHDGRRRNPFNEFECGYHYARSLAAWNVHLAWTGFQYDGVEKRMSFKKDGTWFWSNGQAFGTATVKGNDIKLNVIEGRLPDSLKVERR